MNRWWPAIILFSLSYLSGCDSPPPALENPRFDPADAEAKALAAYDANKDGSLDKKELEKVPGIARGIEFWDTNTDGKVSGVEIRERIQRYVTDGAGLMEIVCQVYLDGVPLEGADVIFVPEAFMGPLLKEATAKSVFAGTITPSIAKSDLLPAEEGLAGLRNGVYKIEVTHPQRKIPEKYNTKTTLGMDVCREASARSGPVAIHVTSN